MSQTIPGPDGKPRCFWCAQTPDFFPYHDSEWGFPVDNDQRLFEKLCLEGFQSGLSWRTILAKRENFRRAFKQFDFNKVARFSDQQVGRLLLDEGIVRHRGKIEAAINNAQRARELVKEFGSLAAYLWQFEPAPIANAGVELVAHTEASRQLSKDLKKRGWKFVGPTTVYAFMQAMGMVNDHAPACVTRAKVDQARKKFKRPQVVNSA